LHFEHPWLFALAVPVTVLSLGLLGLLMASTFILYRHANALSNLLEYPIWVLSGLVFSISVLPGWTHWISLLLPPYWGVGEFAHARDASFYCSSAGSTSPSIRCRRGWRPSRAACR
jgi:hypothetical protein